MRVSKQVQEIIRSKIEKKYPLEDLPEYKEIVETIYDFEERLSAKVDAIVDAEVAAFREYNPIAVAVDLKRFERPTRYRADSDRKYYSRALCDYHLARLPIAAANREHHNKVLKLREEKFNNIILTLELGGTKADLERILSELD